MFGFFLTSLINTSMEHMWLMDVMNMAFFLGATLYWWPMVGLDPIVHWRMGYGARMVNILLGGPPEVILGLAILSSHRPVASMYSLSSTHAGGGLLWVSTEAATLLGFIPIFWQWIRADERAARRADQRTDRMADPDSELTVEDVLAPALVAGAGGAGADGTVRSPTAPGGEGAWEAYWRLRTGRVPGRTAWVPNGPGASPPSG
jgi:hypothetical protein